MSRGQLWGKCAFPEISKKLHLPRKVLCSYIKFPIPSRLVPGGPPGRPPGGPSNQILTSVVLGTQSRVNYCADTTTEDYMKVRGRVRGFFCGNFRKVYTLLSVLCSCVEAPLIIGTSVRIICTPCSVGCHMESVRI